MHCVETRGRPRKVTEAQRIEMWRMYNNQRYNAGKGMGYISIGHKLGLGSETVRYHINQIKKKEREKYDLLLHTHTKSTS